MVSEAESLAFRRVLATLRRFAPVRPACIVLEGETGTGKNFLARYVHDISPWSREPFREANLAAMDDALAGSELFGHVRGAFTDARSHRSGHFVLAHRGTLLLDELGKASLPVQRRLLRVVETGECWPIGAERSVPVDARLVVATNVSLAQLAEEGAFLPDLLARLGAFHVRVPALRERAEDIPVLIEGALVRQAPKVGYLRPPEVSPRLMDVLCSYHWPHNVRQLEAVTLRLLVDAQRSKILQEHLCEGDLEYLRRRPAGEVVLSPQVIREAVRYTGSVVAAASHLGVHRSTLYRALKGPGRSDVEGYVEDPRMP